MLQLVPSEPLTPIMTVCKLVALQCRSSRLFDFSTVGSWDQALQQSLAMPDVANGMGIAVLSAHHGGRCHCLCVSLVVPTNHLPRIIYKACARWAVARCQPDLVADPTLCCLVAMLSLFPKAVCVAVWHAVAACQQLEVATGMCLAGWCRPSARLLYAILRLC